MFINKLNKIIFLLIQLLIFLFLNKRIPKTCLCTIGKLENLYVKEFVLHYVKYGVNKIFIYDNNKKDDERFETVINDFIKKGLVTVINIRDKEKHQYKAMQDCLNKNYKEYDWLIFIDMDEFIYLKKYKNINNYLNKK